MNEHKTSIQADEWQLGTVGEPESPDQIRNYLRDSGFPETLIDRGFKRRETVQDYGDKSWLVVGSSNLGDKFPAYEVLLSDRKYDCACYYHMGGSYRQRHVCSHIIGTIIARRMGLVGGAYTAIETLPDILTIPKADEPLPPPSQRQQYQIMDNMTPANLGFDGDQFASYRPQQIEALNRVIESEKKFVLLQAPTGVGKTLIAASLQRLLGKQVVYCCTTKQLQDQAVEDFEALAEGQPFGATLKGKANYPTLLHPEAFPRINADLCAATRSRPHCILCCQGVHDKTERCTARNSCPYVVARRIAMMADFPILNLSMFMAITKGESDNRPFARAGALVIDEADVVESVLMGEVEVRFTQRWIDRLELPPPAKITVKEAWIEWVENEALPKCLLKLADVNKEIEETGEWQTLRLDAIRERNWLQQAADKMQGFIESVNRGDRWVFLPKDWAFKPVQVGQFGDDLLWRKAPKIVLMSASLLSREAIADDLGIDANDIDFIDLPTDFIPQRRPLYYHPAASMSYKSRQESLPLMKDAIDEILDQHPEQKTLIHTVSYDLSRFLWEKSRHQGRLLSYGKAGERVDVLNQFIDADYPAVLLAPSMERGVDLPGDLCRVVIVCKVPFPNLGDRQVAERFYGTPGGKRWYAIQTARALLQMTGRGMRYEGDWCLTYILDEQFYRFYQDWGWKLLPGYWKEAIIWPGKA